jgi:hypothetical protein
VGKPANFSGAVGHFSLSANVDKNAVKTNEAVTLKVKIAGKGNIKILPEPKVEIPPDFEVYEPKVSQNIQRKNGIISGNKTFEYVLIPRFAGLQSIKPVEFSYFDLGSKTYKTLKTPEITIDVAKGAEEFFTVGSGLSKEEVMLLGQDIRFIKKSIPNFKEMREYFYKGIPFTILIILPVILVIGSLGYRRHLDKLSGDVAYARSRRANQVAMRRLRKAKRLMDEHSHKEFYAEVSRALLGFLGDKLNISEAGILTDQVEEMLKIRGVDGKVVSQYLDCLRSCDYQRFAPSISKDSEMKEFFEKAKRAIVALEKVV